jgi:hypothetical protein
VGYWAFVIAPIANVTITTEKSSANAKITVTASKDQATVDAEKGLLPAVRKEDTQKLTGVFQATGEKDNGTKASGNVTFKNCEDSQPFTIPSGTGVSKGAYTFITQTAINVPGGSFSNGGHTCNSSVSDSVKVVASAAGDQYNLSAGTYTVAGGFGNIIASGTAMGGGTSKIVKVVTDADVEASKAKVMEKAADNVKGKLSKTLLADGLLAVEETFVSSQGPPSPSVAVGAEAPGDVTLTIEITSSMLGVKLTDADPLLKKELTKQINASSQKIYDTGASKAVMTILERPNNDSVKMTLGVSATIGPSLDKTQVAKDIVGKRAGDAKQLLDSKPGVSGVEIRLSPFWVFSIPKNTKKINITINE